MNEQSFRREENLLNKKEVIRNAAIRVMSQKGFYNTKTAEIAHEADVAVGTIYNYFKNKEDILDYIFKFELEKRLNNLEKMKEMKLDFWEKLNKFLEFHFMEVKENMALGEILVREKDFPKKDGSDSINKYLTMIPKLLKEELKKAIENGEIKAENDPEITANMIFGAIQGIVERAINEDNGNMLDEAPSKLIDLLKNGLK